MLRVSQLSGFNKTFNPYDVDAAAFFTAASITDTTQKSAVNQLVLDMKSASIWTKMQAIYPFVGAAATPHSFNLKNTATFQITWSGTITHDANGVTGNGSTGKGDTGINCSSNIASSDDVHISAYSRTSTTDGSAAMGATSSTSSRIGLFPKFSDTKSYSEVWTETTEILATSGAVTNSLGLFTSSRRSSTDAELYRNASSIATNTSARTSSRPNLTIYLLCWNSSGSGAAFSLRNFAFYSIGTGLTGTDVSNLYTAVQAFETTLSRNV